MADVDPLAAPSGIQGGAGAADGADVTETQAFQEALGKFAILLLSGPIMDAAAAFTEDPTGGGSES